MKDCWRDLRKDLFRNIEPSVELVAVTTPVGRFQSLCTTETLPAFTSRACRESMGSKEDDLQLNGNLIKLGHTTPLQAVEFVFLVEGTSKSVQAQWTRHKIGVGWSYRSTRTVPADQNNFVYCTYDYIEDESAVRKLLAIDEGIAKNAIEQYRVKRELDATKQDSRKIMPVNWATTCYFYANARALRHLFELRLNKAAEWEIRRMTAMLWQIVMQKTPSLFKDFAPMIDMD